MYKVHLPIIPGVGGGGTQKFSYIPRLGSIFGLKFLNFNFLGGFQKKNTFLGDEDFMDFFLGSSQNWTSFRVISMYFRVFS